VNADTNDAMYAMAETVIRLTRERDEAWMELCKREAAERTACARSNGISMRYIWQDIARERGYHELLPTK
jgi:hypothetical protein